MENIRDLQNKTKLLYDTLKKIKTKQVSQKQPKIMSMEIVDSYFRNTRDTLIIQNINDTTITTLDKLMQQLLESTQKSTTLKVYKKLTSEIKKNLLTAEKLSLLSSGTLTKKINLDPDDIKILETLSLLSPSAAFAYEQAIIDLQTEDRLSWRGPATDLREALRECLDYLAPDKDVISNQGFKFEKDRKTPTMAQKAQYILKKRDRTSAANKTVKDSIKIIDELLSGFIRSIYNRASVSTHTPTDKNEVTRIKDLVKFVLCELLSIEK